MESKFKNAEKYFRTVTKIVLALIFIFALITFVRAFSWRYLILTLLALGNIGIFFAYFKKDKSMPYVSPFLKEQYFKTKFRMAVLRNRSCCTEKLTPRSVKKISLILMQGYLTLLYHFILLFKNTKESFQIVREDLGQSKFLKIRIRKDGRNEIMTLEKITKRIKEGYVEDVWILEKMVERLFEMHKEKQRKIKVFSLAGMSLALFTVVLSGLISSFIFPTIFKSNAANYTWLQTDWSQGATANSAVHPTNQSNWQEYKEKDANISAGTEITLTTKASSTSQTGIELNSGSLSNTSIFERKEGKRVMLGNGSSLDWGTGAYSGSYPIGNSYDTYVLGNYAYVADKTGGSVGLKILDISNPQNISLVGSLATSDAWSVFATGTYAYIADNNIGLRVIDVSNPVSPVLRSTIAAGAARGLYVTGNYAFVAGWLSGLFIIDISDPVHPTLAANVAISGVRGVYAVGNYAYLAVDTLGLYIVDISDPTHPVTKGNYDLFHSGDVVVKGNYAYVADDINGLVVLNISNPDNPTYVTALDTIDLAENLLLRGNYIYIADRNYFHIADISNPSSPVMVGSYDNPNGSYGVGANENYACLSLGTSGIQVLDITNPKAIKLAGSYNTSGNAWDVEVTDNYAYVADYAYGLLVFDISNPNDPSYPVYRGTYNTTGNSRGVEVSGNYAYVADDTSGLQVINISNPASPSLTGAYDTPGNAYNVFLAGNYAYVADFAAGLEIIDISDPAHPTLTGSFDTAGNAWNVFVSGNYAYVADDTSGLEIINISDPAHPTLTGNYDTPGIAHGVFVVGNYAYVGDDGSGLEIINVSNPSNPTLTGSYDTMGYGYGVYVSGNYAYLGDYGSGVIVLNISNPASPIFAGTYNTPSNARFLDVLGNYIYVGDDASGLQIIKTGDYPASGTFTSSASDTGKFIASWADISWNTVIPTNTQIILKAKSSTTAQIADFSACNALATITSANQIGSVSMSGNNCVNTGDRYIKYYLELSNTDNKFSPSFKNITFSYNYYPSSQTLTSSPYNTTDIANILNKIQWTETRPAGTDIMFQLRTSADNISWSNWFGPTGGGDYYTDPTGGEIIYASHRDASADQWFQYKVFLTSDGKNTPILSDVSLTYVVNATPLVQNVTAAQNGDGSVSISYEVKDPDTTTGSVTPGYVSPSFQYWNGTSWISCATMAQNDTANKAVEEGDFNSYTATWTAATDFSGHFMDNTARIKVLANDNELANNIGSSTSADFLLDTVAPASPNVKVDASSTPSLIMLSATDDSSMQMKVSLNSDLSGASWQNYAASLNMALATDPDTVYAQFRDSYNNITNIVNATNPNKPTNFIYQDISNSQDSVWREFIAWKVIAEPATGFKSYNIYRSENGASYSLLTNINTRTTNYYIDNGVADTKTYYYKLTAQDNNGGISSWTQILSDKPNGQGGTDVTRPTISNVATSSISTTQAMITWDTDELSNSTVGYSTTPGDFTTEAGLASMADTASGIGQHVVTLTGLTPRTTYYFLVKSQDPSENIASSTQGADGYMFTTLPGASISDVSASSIGNTSATITWNTDIESDSQVIYSLNPDLSGAIQAGNAILAQAHSVNLNSLLPGTQYYYYVQATDESNNLAKDTNGSMYYNFFTTQDSLGPVISAVSASLVTDTSAVITWETNEGSTSKVDFGIMAGIYASSTVINANLDISHSAKLTPLLSDTKYYYQVISRDGNNNTSTSTENNFTTLEELSTATEVTEREMAARSEGETTGRQNAGGGGIIVIDKTDKAAPIIKDIRAGEIKSDSAKILWKTDEVANSFLEYGKDASYGNVTGDYKLATDHLLEIKYLEPERSYHYRVVSVDSSGNLAQSTDQIFSTILSDNEPATPEAKKEEQEKKKEKLYQDIEELTKNEGVSKEEIFMNAAVAAQKAMDIIKEISSQVSINMAENTISSQYDNLKEIANIIPAPIMSGEPRVITTATTAIIAWKTDRESNSMIALAPESEYKISAGKEDPYLEVRGNPTEKVKEHVITIFELEPETVYHYQLRSQADFGPMAKSADFVFKTKSESLEITNYAVQNISNEKAVFKWVTNLETDSQVRYIPYRDNKLMLDEAKTAKNNAMSIIHEVEVDDFEAGIIYDLELAGKDIKGQQITKSIPLFSTSKDDLPPIIYQVQTDSAISPGKEEKIQTIISWQTNEPSTTRVYYAKGIGEKEEFSEKTALDNNFVKKHVTIITKFEPGMVYSFKVESIDSGGNASMSKTYTILTPRQKESVFQVIMKNIEKTFGWMGKIKE